MLVLNEANQVTHTKDKLLAKATIKNLSTQSSDRKKLNTANIAFLKSLGFIVRDIQNDRHVEYQR
jgi:hypothetical protein